jgi:hypothetical protein
MEQVRVADNLPAIKISLALQGTGVGRAVGDGFSQVRFEVLRGRETLSAYAEDPAALGIPDGFDPASYQGSEPRFLLTRNVAVSLVDGLQRLFSAEREPLWLQLASPIGYLAALPWERTLREDPVLRTALPANRPLLRIPDFTVALDQGDRSVTVVLCVSDPEGGPPSPVVRSLPSVLNRALYRREPPRIHVFATPSSYDIWRYGSGHAGSRLFVHDPRETRGSTPPGADPWLAWIQREMAGIPVDVVHFVTPGHVDGREPSIALAESPAGGDARLWARLISPTQLAGSLTQLGAWLTGFSSPPGNSSTLGLRMFADQLARLRPGTVVHHAGDPFALAGIYRSLLSGEAASLGPDDFMYVHPRLAGVQGTPSYAESLVADELGRGEARPSPWVTRTRRYLDESVAQLFPGRSEHDPAERSPVAEGVRAALRFVDEVMHEHGGTDR